MSIRDKPISGPLGFGSAPLGNIFRNIPGAARPHPRSISGDRG
jgi:hypothetical protein